MESATFDLLPAGKKNDAFRVSFDFYTPRAHFVLLPRTNEDIDPDLNRITSQNIYQLLEAAKSMLSSSRISSGTLSIHCGSWISTRSKFLAHLCVDVEKYLDIFERRKCEIPRWPSGRYVTKQWKANKNPSSYAANVRGYPFMSYFSEDVAQIQRLVDDESLSSDPTTFEHSGMHIVYHPAHPKVGFLGKKVESTEELQKVLEILREYARSHGLTNAASRDEDNGCHLCLCLGSETSDWNFADTASGDHVVGYIVTTGSRFYRLCPPNRRFSWFEAFKQSNFACTT